MGGRINTIMQTCFFAISGILPREQAIEEIKKAIKKTYGKRGEAVVQKNFEAVDQTLAHLNEVKLDGRKVSSKITRRSPVPDAAPEFVKEGARPDDRRRRRFTPGQRDAAGRNLSRPVPPSGRSATSRSRSPSGSRTCASSAANALWSARTR